MSRFVVHLYFEERPDGLRNTVPNKFKLESSCRRFLGDALHQNQKAQCENHSLRVSYEHKHQGVTPQHES